VIGRVQTMKENEIKNIIIHRLQKFSYDKEQLERMEAITLEAMR